MLGSNQRPLTSNFEKIAKNIRVGTDGIEPSTSSLSVKRSTGELHAQIFFDKISALPGCPLDTRSHLRAEPTELIAQTCKIIAL